MSRDVPIDEPLTDEDRKYLLSRGREDLVTRIDEEQGVEDTDAANSEVLVDPEGDPEPPANYPEWTVADLDEELRRRQLSVTGSKADKVNRLESDDAGL